MNKKPTYEELEQRVKNFEKEAVEHKAAQKELQLSEQQLSLIYDSVADILYYIRVDPDDCFRFLSTNQSFLKATGLTRDQVVGKRIEEVIPETSIRLVLDNYKKAVEENRIVRWEETSVYPAGVKIGEVSIAPVLNETGICTHLVGSVHDITERKQAEEVVRKSEERFRTAGKAAYDLIYEWDVASDTLEWFGDIDGLLGYKKNEISRDIKAWLDLIHPEDKGKLENAVDIHRTSAEPIQYEYRVRHKEGTYRAWNDHALPLFDDKGCPYKWVGVCTDITKRKQAEDLLWESERKYSALVQESPDAIISLDKIGNLLSFNPAAERISGFSAEEVIGKHFAKIGALAKKSIPKALKEFALVITGTKRPPFELTIMRKDKSYLFMEANPRLIKHKGKKAWVQVTLRDITDRKLVEAEKKQLETQLQQSQKIESIGTLAGGIAHDFNNILGIIIGNTELAMDDIPKRDRAYFNLEEIQKASLRAKDVVKQLLSFARKTDLERKSIKLIPVIKDSIQLLRAIIPMNIDIRQNITDTSDTIFADPTQINQVIINLCTNASHAMQEKGGILGIEMENVIFEEDSDTLHPDLTPGSYVKLTISDTGQGIDPELKDRIFDPYFTTKEIGKGTGMGLSVVHGIVQNHGGSISVESELGKGATFYIYFPVIEEEAVIETDTVEELPKGNERILFVDDEESIVYVGRYRLERLGYQVVTKTSPKETLELFRANPDQFDLVITDMAMPQMTGDQMIKEILKIRPDTPTILCTGFSEKIDEEKAKEIGIRQYIEKPFNRSDLAKLVRTVLDEK